MNDSDSEADPLGPLAEEFAERYRRGERPVPERVHREVPRAGRAHPRPLPRAGGDGGARLGRRAGRRWLAGTAGGPGTGPAAARRLPHPPRGRPRRHGGRLRGGAGVARPARRAEGPAPDGRTDAPTHLERFRREARAAARLHHTNIVPVFGVGEDEGVHYYAMQFIQGQGLDASCTSCGTSAADGPRPPDAGTPRGADLSVSVARGLLTGRFPARGAAAGRSDRRRPVPAEDCGRPDRMRSRRRGPTPSCSAILPGSATSRTLAYSRERGPGRGAGGRGAGLRPPQGILHRDIKPSNLLLDTPGHGLGHRLRPGQGRRHATT